MSNYNNLVNFQKFFKIKVGFISNIQVILYVYIIYSIERKAFRLNYTLCYNQSIYQFINIYI